MSDSSTGADEQKWYESPLFLFALLGAVGLSTLGYWWLIHSWNTDYEKTGQFGDTFGALNAVFTGLAFAGLIFSIMQQRRDLRMQREELALQRQELRLQREEQVNTRGVFERQNFETTFFNMLNLLNSVTETLKFTHPRTGESIESRQSFGVIWHDILNNIGAAHKNEVTFQKAVRAYDSTVYRQYESSLAHYWRLLYNILKFIKSAPFPHPEKERYAHLVRANLGRDEVLLLSINAATPRGQKMKHLIEEFGLLKHIPDSGFESFVPQQFYRTAAFRDEDEGR